MASFLAGLTPTRLLNQAVGECSLGVVRLSVGKNACSYDKMTPVDGE